MTASEAQSTTELDMVYCMQELSDEKKRLEKELEEQKKFISVVKSAVSHLS